MTQVSVAICCGAWRVSLARWIYSVDAGQWLLFAYRVINLVINVFSWTFKTQCRSIESGCADSDSVWTTVLRCALAVSILVRVAVLVIHICQLHTEHWIKERYQSNT